jgi:hypothetical protein
MALQIRLKTQESNICFQSCIPLLLGLVVFFNSACSDDVKARNEQAVENLNVQIKREKFDEIYEQSTNQVKTTISKNDFIERMKVAVRSMKSVDPALNWTIKGDQKEFYRDFSIEDTSLRTLESNAKTINIWIYWDNFSLCGFETSEIKVFMACG